MKLPEKAKNAGVRKVLSGVALMGGFFAFLGAGTASARPRVGVGFGFGGPLVGGYYAAPAPHWSPAYVGPAYVVRPRYRYGYYDGARHRYWDARLRGWR
jgi:hypothetical protein